jgi:glycosyltransferase involved in cell wall biosynthesis
LTSVVNDIPGGTRELIEDGVTGFNIKGNEVKSFAATLKKLNSERTLLTTIGVRSKEKAEHFFNPCVNSSRYEQLFERCYLSERRVRKVGRVYGSRLDQYWIPNFITQTIRRF